MLSGTDERSIALQRTDEDRCVLKRIERLAGIASCTESFHVCERQSGPW